MAHWASLAALDVRPAEWRILRAMDVGFITSCRELAAQEREQAGGGITLSEQPMTPELFDAIF
jgi:hypothetical protein